MKNKEFLLDAFKKGFYSCDIDGNIFSHQKSPNDKKANTYCRKLKDRTSSSTGYLQVVIVNNGVKKFFNAHQVVFLYFNRESDFENKHINHINHNKTCNMLPNLELVTPSQNFIHALKAGRAQRKLTLNQVKEIRSLSDKMKTREISEKFNIGMRMVRHIIVGNSWANI